MEEPDGIVAAWAPVVHTIIALVGGQAMLLQYAALYGHGDTMALLLREGADVHASTSGYAGPLFGTAL